MASAAHRGDRIPLARPAVGDPEVGAAERALRSGWLVVGPENQRFEVELAERCARAHAICVSSGTTALALALWELGVGPGDEVAIAAFGFPAAANCVAARGARPIAVDVTSDTWTLDVAAAERAITPRTRAVISIDQLGLVAEAAPLVALAAARDVALIDDAACGLGGADAAGVPGGGKGRTSTLSFHPRKLITTGEGGAVLCDDPELAARLRRLRNHGQQTGPDGRRFVEPGTNARLSEIAAAIGTAQLERLDAMLAERALLVAGYRERLARLREDRRLSWQVEPAGSRNSHQSFAVVLAERYSRDAVIARLDAAGVEAGPATYAFHRLPPFAGAGDVALPVADALHDRALALPLFVGMRARELDRVADAVEEALA